MSPVLAELRALVVPPVCVACRAPLAPAEEVLCPRCRAELPWLPTDRCPRCALPGRCAPCPARRAVFAASWAPLAHDGVARAVVAALKFRGAFAVADAMAAQMLAGVPAGVLDDGAVLVPVPAAPARVRARGYDHAAVLADALAARGGLPRAAVLRSAAAAPRQVGASRAQRLAVRERHAFRALAPAPRHSVLVDDVHTTGATLDACARVLRVAGAARVTALTYTRALR